MDYQITNFDGVRNITVKTSTLKTVITIPIVDDLFITGTQLDNYIQGILQSREDEKNLHIPSNISEIQNLVVPEQFDAEDYRIFRNKLLTATDWTTLNDNTLTQAEKEAWRLYRQSLRDLTNQENFPQSINWPIPPGPVRLTVGHKTLVDASGQPGDLLIKY